MSLLDAIRRDAVNITSNSSDFATQITVSKGDVGVTVGGIAGRHHFGLDELGNVVNTMQAHCAIAEQVLIDAGLNLRNAKGLIATGGITISWTDTSGRNGNYTVKSIRPDETIGLLTFILQNG